jgi:hypothetical protein
MSQVEGHESDVLRCFPFATFRPRAVLLETNRMGDLRSVGRFFHRHGYINRETFVTAEPHGTRAPRPQWSDNLYERLEGRPTVYPPTHGVTCAEERKHRGEWCGPWLPWQPEAGLGACNTLAQP